MKKDGRVFHRVLIAAAALTLLPLTAFADDKNEFKVDPFNFGLGTLATWARDAGKPGQKGDPKQYGLYLQKHNPPGVKSTDNFAAAGARITKIRPLPVVGVSRLVLG